MVTEKATIEITADIPCPTKLMSPPNIRREDSFVMAFKNGALLDLKDLYLKIYKKVVIGIMILTSKLRESLQC